MMMMERETQVGGVLFSMSLTIILLSVALSAKLMASPLSKTMKDELELLKCRPPTLSFPQSAATIGTSHGISIQNELFVNYS